jgi:hypothetical protein
MKTFSDRNKYFLEKVFLISQNTFRYFKILAPRLGFEPRKKYYLKPL